LLHRILAGLTLFACFPPLLMGVLAVASRSTELAMLGIDDTPATQTLGLFFGLAAFGVGLNGVLASVWLVQGRRAGAVVAAVVGGSMAYGGVVMMFLADPKFAILDLAKGAMVAALALVVLSRQPESAPIGHPTR
jgi:hypothetical protein